MIFGFHPEPRRGDWVPGPEFTWPYREGDRVRLARICGLLPPGNYRVAGVLNDFLFLGEGPNIAALGMMYAQHILFQPDPLAPLISEEEQLRFGEKQIEFLQKQSPRRRRRRGKGLL